MCRLSIVIPTFNEKENIEKIVSRIDRALIFSDNTVLEKEIIFVDDSTDDTPEAILQAAKDRPYIRLKHRENERGLATAVFDGFKMGR